MYPAIVPHREREPEYSYAGIVVRAHPEIRPTLRALRFSGWIGPDEDGWVVLVCRRLARAVTVTPPLDRDALAAHLAAAHGGPAFAVHVHRDRVLALAGWRESEPLGAYLSNPAYGHEDDDDPPDPEPRGAEHAAAYASACDRADRAEALEELLGEVLDEEQTESERLWSVLRLLGLPSWLVGSTVLPKEIVGGPSRPDVTPIHRGREGRLATVAAWRRRRKR